MRSTRESNDTRSGFVPGRFVSYLLVAALALGSAGCERVRAWLVLVRGEGVPATRGLPAAMGAYDCPPGVVRCVEGRVERSIGGAIDARTLERHGCPFEVVDTCGGRCLDDEDHLEEEVPTLCLGDAAYRERHPFVEPVQDAGIDGGDLDPREALRGEGGLRGDGVEASPARTAAEARP
jgi:hypothetical protein